MSTTQLVGVITLVGTLLLAGIQIGMAKYQLSDIERRLQRVETSDKYFHGDTDFKERH